MCCVRRPGEAGNPIFDFRFSIFDRRGCRLFDCGGVERLDFRLPAGEAASLPPVARVLRMRRKWPENSSVEAGTALLSQASDPGGSRLSFLRPRSLRAQLALWHGGLPVDVLPAEGFLEIPLGEETSWPIENS